MRTLMQSLLHVLPFIPLFVLAAEEKVRAQQIAGGTLVLDNEVPYANARQWSRWPADGREGLPRAWAGDPERRRAANGDELALESRLLELDPLEQRATMELRASLWREGELVHEWRLEMDENGWRRLVSPEPFTDVPWKGGFIRWADETFDPETAEAVIVLRRSCDIGMGRGMDLEAIPVALELGPIMEGICYSMQPDVMPDAFRNYGSIRDFGEHPDALLSGSDEPVGT